MTSVRMPSISNTYNSNGFSRQDGDSPGNATIEQFTKRYQGGSFKDNSNTKKLLRDLNKPTETGGAYDFNKKFTATSINKSDGFLKLAEATATRDLEKAKTPSNYKYKRVSSQILAAKNSISAGKALLAAKRGVLEIRGKLSSGKGDSEELMIELTHAKKMEMAARKKKHHLELEEMVEKTQAMDEKLDKLKESTDLAQDAASFEVQAAEEELLNQEDAIFDERSQMMTEAIDQISESGEEISEEAMAELNMMIADFGEEELEQLEEAMEMLENMEILDPHMSEDALKRLKTRHRASEFKQVAKADTEYIRDMIKHIEDRGTPSMAISTSAGVPQSPQISVSIDVSI